MPVPMFPSTSRSSAGNSSDEDGNSKSRGRSLSKLFSRSKKSGGLKNKSKAISGPTSASNMSRMRSSSADSGGSRSRGRSESPYARGATSGKSRESSPSPSRGFTDEGEQSDRKEDVTPTNAFVDVDDDDASEEEELEDDDDDDDDDGYEEVTKRPAGGAGDGGEAAALRDTAEEWDPVTDEEIELFRNTSINTGDRPVMNILQSQSQMPAVEDDHPNMLPGEKEVFFVPSDDQPLESLLSASKKRLKPKKALPLNVSDPLYERNRCTITLENGTPRESASKARRVRRYLVACDLSEESVYAIEWAIGTVLRDGDEAIVVSVIETDTKFDPDPRSSKAVELSTRDRLRIQNDRKERAQMLADSVRSLLRRTRLNVEILCQAIHARNARHMLVDMIDYVEPTLVIVGSRGLTKIKNMLLGSVSYYLVQKSSVPVMVARRRLRQHARPRKHMSQLDRHARVPLSHAETEMESHAAEVHSTSDEDGDSSGGSEDGTELGDVSDNKSEKSHQGNSKARATTDESGPGSGSDSDERSEDEHEEEGDENQSTLTAGQADASTSSSAAEGLQS